MNWNSENYAMQQAMNQMGMPMNMPPPLPPMDVIPGQDVPPLNPPPPVPMQLMSQAPDTTNQENGQFPQEEDKNDVSSTQNQKKLRDRSSNQRRERERDRASHRSRSKERDHNRQGRDDRQDKGRRGDRPFGGPRERRTKWGDRDKDLSVPVMSGMHVPGMTGPGMPGPGITGPGMPGPGVSGNMMVPQGMGGFPNMQHPSMMPPNMMHQNLQQQMMMQQQMDGSMMPSMNMMNNMMPNMMDQNMMMMNQQMMSMMGNQQFYTSIGVVLPPAPGAQIPQRRDKPKGCRTIFVGGLPNEVTLDTLSEIFQRCGPIDDIKSPKNGAFYVRFQRPESVEQSFIFSGHRFKLHDQLDNEATTIFVDYASNREDQNEYEKQQRNREPTPPRVEPFTPAALNNLTEKIKTEEEFANVAPTLAAWLERGECSKKNANAFYSLVQVSNNQIRRLFNEKMQLDDEFQNMKSSFREKFAHVLLQFELVAKILSAAKHQRVSDHFTKQQRRNIEMWLKMTEEVVNIREEFQAAFDEEENEKPGKNMVSLEKYEELKMENENLTYELEGYKNEAHLAKDEAERKFEKFKAHFIAQQALQNKPQVFPPLPKSQTSPLPPPPLPKMDVTSAPVPPSEAKLISILTAFLMVHPLGASLDYLTSYVKSMTPNVAQADVQSILLKYADVFQCKTSGVGASMDHRWVFATFDIIKGEPRN